MLKVVLEVYEWLYLAGFQFGDKTKIGLAYSLVDEEIQEMKDGSKNQNHEEVKDGFSDTTFCLLNACYFEGIKAEDVAKKFDKVVLSNYSKFCKTREEAVASAEAYCKGKHFTKPNEFIEAKIQSTGNEIYPYVVIRTKDSKILKSLNYRSPNKF